MQTIPISEIIIADRQRREFKEDKLNDLSQSIQQKGLLHPIVLQDDKRTLVAGERRIRAANLLYLLEIGFTHNGLQVPQGHMPYVTLASLSPDDLVEAELEENLLREDLSWAEEADAIAKLHSLRIKKNPGQTYKDTAVEAYASEPYNASQSMRVKESVIIKEHLSDPDVAKAKSRKEALKVIKRKEEAKFTAQLAESFDVNKTPHILYHGNFLEASNKFLETSSVDIICTDPPYGVGANEFGDQAGATHEYDDSRDYFEKIIAAFVVEATRVAKTDAHLYTFCDPRGFRFIQEHLGKHGWNVWRTPIIWNKGNGMLPEPEYGPRRTYEFVLYARRGNKKARAVYPDVINVNGLSTPKFGAEKPPAVFTNLLRRSAYPGELVWEPFCGAGPIFAAANELSLRVVASELIEDKYNYAKLRMDEKEEALEDLLA